MRFPGRNDPYDLSTRARRHPASKTPKPALSLSAARSVAATPTPSIGAQTPGYAPFLDAPPSANKRITRRT